MEEGSFSCGDVTLVSGQILSDATLIYRKWGQLSEDGDNCILIPAYYGGTTLSYQRLIGPGSIFDTDRFCVIVPGLFGGGESTSPSTYSLGAAAFPLLDMRDNVRCQQRFLQEAFGVETLALIAGWSLGGMQALYWGAMYPAAVRRVLAICASANCWPQNEVFLEGMQSILCAAPEYQGGAFCQPPVAALKAFARNYCGWAYCPAFFRKQRYRELGMDDLAAFLLDWERDHLGQSADDLLAVIRTWKSSSFRNSLSEESLALSSIVARTILMPSVNDAYFTLPEIMMEAAEIPHVEAMALETDYGHCAGAPGRFDIGTEAMRKAVAALLGPAT